MAQLNFKLLFAAIIFTAFGTGCAGTAASSTSLARPSTSANPGSSVDDGSGGVPTTPSAPIDYCVDTTSASTQVKELREQICELSNIERAKVGVAPLRLDDPRSAVAQAHAEDMATNNFFSHTSPTTGSMGNRLSAAGISFSSAGENIASNSYIDAQLVMNQWMASAGHRANILNGSFRRLGVGYSNRRWVQVFTN